MKPTGATQRRWRGVEASTVAYYQTHGRVAETVDGVTRYQGCCNEAYIVFPDGTACHRFGYHGTALMTKVRNYGAATTLRIIKMWCIAMRFFRRALAHSAAAREAWDRGDRDALPRALALEDRCLDQCERWQAAARQLEEDAWQRHLAASGML